MLLGLNQQGGYLVYFFLAFLLLLSFLRVSNLKNEEKETVQWLVFVSTGHQRGTPHLIRQIAVLSAPTRSSISHLKQGKGSELGLDLN